MDQRQKEGHIYIAICDFEIASEGCHQGNHRMGPTLVIAISDCDITSKGGISHRRKVNLIGRGFIRSEKVK